MTSHTPIRILLIDDDAFALDALQQYFSSTQDIQVVKIAHNGAEGLQSYLEDPEGIDLVLSDIHMPGMTGVELLQALQQQPQPPVFVAMTSLDTDETMLEVLTHGGAGYIIKSSRPQQLIQAIRDAMEGGTPVSPACLSRLVEFIDAPAKGSHSNTTVEEDAETNDREQYSPSPAKSFPQPESATHGPKLNEGEQIVLEMLVQGLSNAEIAQKALYSESTVKKYISSLMKKFNASSRLKLAIIALHSGY